MGGNYSCLSSCGGSGAPRDTFNCSPDPNACKPARSIPRRITEREWKCLPWGLPIFPSHATSDWQVAQCVGSAELASGPYRKHEEPESFFFFPKEAIFLNERACCLLFSISVCSWNTQGQIPSESFALRLGK